MCSALARAGHFDSAALRNDELMERREAGGRGARPIMLSCAHGQAMHARHATHTMSMYARRTHEADDGQSGGAGGHGGQHGRQ
jgi:hypothetical protein